jgi:uncharacterized protein (TIGR00661 family)
VRKKVLYAVQATGNGHLSRCMEFYPALSKYADVDVLLSGIQGDLKLPFDVKYHRHGMGFIFGKKGGIDYLKTALSLRPFRFIWDVWSMDLSQYDLVINDFEPITAWACRLRRKTCVGLSHQAAFLSKRTPRPKARNWLAEFIFKHFAPCNRKVGLHFQRYDKYIYTPVVRSEIRVLKTHYIANQCLVYLPAYSHELLIPHFRQVSDIEFIIFSKHTLSAEKKGNIQVFPVGKSEWIKYVCSTAMAIIGGGFEGTSEMLYLGKKLMVIPMTDQYEQHCNAEALKRMGVEICYHIGQDFSDVLLKWSKEAKVVDVDFPAVSDEIARKALAID